jgi:hypothetical protein
MKDTWLLDAADVPMQPTFGKAKSRTIWCVDGSAKINPEFRLQRLESLELPAEVGIGVRRFAEWYVNLRRVRDRGVEDHLVTVRKRNPWTTRGFRVVLVPPA